MTRSHGMKWTIGTCAGLALAIVQGGAIASAGADDVLGTWLTEEGASRIQFVECGAAICGDIVWIHQREAVDENGNPVTDVNNPDPALRNRPLVGLRIFSGFRPLPGDDNEWEGSVYNPEDGDTYQTFLIPQPDGRLRVRGCVLGGWICDSEWWTRAEAAERGND